VRARKGRKDESLVITKGRGRTAEGDGERRAGDGVGGESEYNYYLPGLGRKEGRQRVVYLNCSSSQKQEPKK
jgi:hypothetical protein